MSITDFLTPKAYFLEKLFLLKLRKSYNMMVVVV